MKDTLQFPDRRTKVYTYWRHAGLGDFIKEGLTSVKATEVHLLLSQDYDWAAGGAVTGPWVCRLHDFSDKRSGSTHYRGLKLRELLESACRTGDRTMSAHTFPSIRHHLHRPARPSRLFGEVKSGIGCT